MPNRQELLLALNAVLEPDRFKDYCPNGLQVEGRWEVRKIVSGVTASLALIDAAVAAGADALFVHHGLFWRGHDGRVTGWLRQRLARLLENDINLFAYHLPLDAHVQWGNNAQLGFQLGLHATGRFGDQELGWIGVRSASVRPGNDVLGHHNNEEFSGTQALATHVETVLGRTVLAIPGKPGPLRRIAWCSGGAQGYFEAAIAAGADAFITGEISEPQAHLVRESGVAFLACGHHATERYGAPAVAGLMAEQFGLEHLFIDIDNPA
jgi:dinuclear metal center YbgI/SA1388 family protein